MSDTELDAAIDLIRAHFTQETPDTYGGTWDKLNGWETQNGDTIYQAQIPTTELKELFSAANKVLKAAKARSSQGEACPECKKGKFRPLGEIINETNY